MAIDNKDKKVLKSSIEREKNELACSAECEKIKGSKNLNVPHLRFPEFQGEWERMRLDAFTERIMRKNKNNQSKLPLTISAQYGLVDQITFFNKVIASTDMSNYYLLKKGEFAYNKSYSSDYPWGAIKRLDNYDQGALSSLYICFTPQDNVVSNFILQYFESPKWHKGVSEIAVEGARNHGLLNVSVQDFFHTYHYVPKDKNEQIKISKLLMLLDERIATQNKIIEDLKKLKSAISHILFSSKGAIHLSEIANVVMGQSPSSNAYNDQVLGMPLVQGNLDISNGKTTPRLYTAEFNQTTEKGNIILTVRAPVGEVAKATQKVCVGRGVCAIIPHEENMSDFIYQYLTFYKFMWRRYEQGSTFTSINGSDVRNILCPKVRNVSILTLLDRKINIEERVVKLYQSQKQYMLYQMFI